MATLLSFTVESTNVAAGLATITNSLHDLRPFWVNVFAPKYFAMVQDMFATSGTPRGPGGRFSAGGWKWLSSPYREWKAKHYPGKGILVRTGALKESLRWGGTGLGNQGIFDPQPSFVVAGTSVSYGQYHRDGTSKMPARPFLPPPDPAVFAPLLQQWLLKQKGTT